jgi:hypothetical protein
MGNGKWVGTGCGQDATIDINKARIQKNIPAVPIEISDGIISIGKIEFNNLIPLPFNMTGLCRLNLQFVNGYSFEVYGEAINIEMKGEAKFVENLPEEWSPNSSE